jgi:CDGSH-type Zn-finger protein
MKLLHNGRHIKNIPKRYSSILDIAELIDDLDHKRLSDTERRVLNEKLLSNQVQHFLRKKCGDSKFKPFLTGTHPVKVQRIETRYLHYHVIRMANGHELRCPAEVFRSSPIKETIKRLY